MSLQWSHFLYHTTRDSWNPARITYVIKVNAPSNDLRITKDTVRITMATLKQQLCCGNSCVDVTIAMLCSHHHGDGLAGGVTTDADRCEIHGHKGSCPHCLRLQMLLNLPNTLEPCSIQKEKTTHHGLTFFQTALLHLICWKTFLWSLQIFFLYAGLNFFLKELNELEIGSERLVKY